MKTFLDCANRYVQESDWKVIAVLKFCLMSMGIMIGLSVPARRKKPLFAVAAAVFVVTYIPLMVKYVKIVCNAGEKP